MYRELFEFLGATAFQKAIWKDGEIWTSGIVGILGGVWIYNDVAVAEFIRTNFANILTVASIIFGFVMSTLVFYLQAALTWSKEARVQRVADKLIDWHIWTVLWLVFLIAYTIALWVFDHFVKMNAAFLGITFGFHVFVATYSGTQILNHVLTIRWVFRKRAQLVDRPLQPAPNLPPAQDVPPVPEGVDVPQNPA